ncbi:MAG: F0F1 ATP synthase subunit B [Alphaproteobacteria bacterium]|nr:F0F1 ATP synthase subunit B [Alphaproteobacteria bacterium]
MLHDTSFWVGVAFVIFVVLAWRPLSRTLVTALDERAETIRNNIDEATRLREEAQALLASYKRKQRNAAQEAEEILRHARSEAGRLKEQAIADLEALLARREQQALDRIAQAEAQATAEVRGLAVDLAVAATRRLLTERAGGVAAAMLIDQSIKQIDEKLH